MRVENILLDQENIQEIKYTGKWDAFLGKNNVGIISQYTEKETDLYIKYR